MLLDVIDNYFKTAVCTNELNEQFHSNTEERRFFVCSAVLFLLDSTGPRTSVIGNDDHVLSGSGSIERKLRMCVWGTGSNGLFMSRYFIEILLRH